MDPQLLLTLGKPCLYATACSDEAFENLRWPLSNLSEQTVVRFIRGERCTTVPNLHDEVSAVLQFPYYYGHNWAALDECIRDLDWMEGDVYILLVRHAGLLLREADHEDFAILMRILLRANLDWVTPNAYIPRTRVPTPFHVLLQGTAPDLQRFQSSVSSSDLVIMDPILP